jgi:hypothetical protein
MLTLGSAESEMARWGEESREEFTLFFAFSFAPSRFRVLFLKFGNYQDYELYPVVSPWWRAPSSVLDERLPGAGRRGLNSAEGGN